MRYLTLRSGASLAALFAATSLHAQTPAVITDIPVTHALVAQVMEGVGTPDLLLDRGADPHHFQLRPSQARAVAGAGLVVWIGPDLTPWLGRTTDALSDGQVLELLAVEGTQLQPYAESRLLAGDQHGHAHEDHGHDDHDDEEHDHDDHGHDDHGHAHDDDGHDEHEDEDHGDHSHGDHDHAEHDHSDHDHGHSHDHSHGAIDAHAWLNPDNARTWLAAIAEELATLDPGNAATYRSNAQAAQERITALKSEMETILEPARDTGIVVYHDAYGYLAESFGLNVLGAITLGDAATPGAARLSTIRANLEQAGAECIFPEANHPDAYVALVIEGSALRVGRPLDPAATALEPGPALYETMMRDMAQTIADCATGN